MRLIKCYIENFGKLHAYEYDFNSNFNEIIELNGWGKTTFATFIKAMFYGLPKTSKQKLIENERKKYHPWQGGAYGGFLEFQIDEESFRIERYFGATESKDIFKLIDLKTGKLTDKYDKNIGEQIFGLDSDAYERCTFIPQKEISDVINESISSKLINMIQGTNSIDSYENALKIIKDKSSELERRGGAGKIAQVQAEIDDITDRIDSLNNNKKSIETLTTHIENYSEIIKNIELKKIEIDSQINEYSKNQKYLANKKYYQENLETKKALQKEIDEYSKILNDNDLSDDELKKYIEMDNNLVMQKSKMQTLQESNMQNDKYDELSSFFKDYCPSEDELKLNIENAQRSLTLQTETAAQKIGNVNKKSFIKGFNYKILSVLLLVLTLGLVVAGCCIVSFRLTLSLIFFVMAFFSLIACLFIYFKNYIEEKTKTISFPVNSNNSSEDFLEKAKELQLLNDELDKFISKFSKVDVDNKLAYLYDLNSKVKEFHLLEEQIKLVEDNIVHVDNEIKLLDKDINKFLSKFNFNKQHLSNKDKLDLLRTILENINKTQKDLNNVVDKISAFEKENEGCLDEGNIADLDINDLQQKQKEIQDEMDKYKDLRSSYVHKIDEMKSELSEMKDLKDNLAELNLLKNELINQLNTLNNAKEFLTKANDNLSSKYLTPMRNGLNKYLQLILNNNEIKYDLDTDLNVSFFEKGASREIGYLSKGYKEVVDLSIRFALIETLFQKEKPFIVLDDPFANMDEEKLKGAMLLLQKISDEYQILYLICHKSRRKC